MTIGKRILQARIDARLTQQQLAEAIGKTRGAVAQWESGLTNPREKILETIARTVNVTKEWLLVGDSYAVKRAVNTLNAKTIAPTNFDATKKIPVYGQAVGGEDGEFPMNKKLFEIACPPRLLEASGAYGVIVSGETMSPRYLDGEIVYIDPTRRVRRGDFIVALIMIDEQKTPYAFIKKFIKHDSKELVLEQFNPAKELHFLHGQVICVHYIAMSSDGIE